MRYDSGEISEGVVAAETIRFLRRDTTVGSAANIIFGCSKTTTGFQRLANTAVGGFMGLSWAPESLAAQLESNRRSFSYCLSSFALQATVPSTLAFGDAVPAPPPHLLATHFLRKPDPDNHHFYLNLLDITVGSRRLGFPRGTFGFLGRGRREAGFVINSGVAFSYLADTGRIYHFSRVEAAFRGHCEPEGLVRTAVSGGLDSCYRYPDGFDQFVSMTYHFEGADYVVDAVSGNLFGNDVDIKFLCMPGLNGGKISILGAVHQQNIRVVYDGVVNELQFYSEICR